MKKQNNEPEIIETDYHTSLIKALNFYNETWGKDDYKNSTIEFAIQLGIDLPKNIHDNEYRNIGAICRLLLRNQFVQVNHYNYVVKRLNELKNFKKQEVIIESQKEIIPKKEVKIQFLEDLEDIIDTYILTKKFDIKKVVSKYNSYSYGVIESKKVESIINKNVKMFNTHFDEWDDDIKDSYPNLVKGDIKKLVDMLLEFKTSISMITSVKARPKKQKAPSIQVKNIPYLNKYEAFTGIHPKTLIGKSLAVVYDTETRELILLESIASKFTASGQTFGNLDTSKCKKKKLRKPEEQLKFFMEKATKKEIQKYFDDIKTTAQNATGRMNENKIIIGVL